MKEIEREEFLEKMFFFIQQNPGIRPRDLNRLLARPHTAHYRRELINRGFVKKVHKGSAVYYYPTDKK